MAIQVQVNGEKKSFDQAINLNELIKKLSLEKISLAIALNDEVIPQSEFNQTYIKNGDFIEIVQASAGG